MRIIGEFDIAQIKVTVFAMNERISVKYEYNLMEQTYKFRDGSGIRTVDDVKKYSDTDTIKNIMALFDQMSAIRMNGIRQVNQLLDEEEFAEIL